MKLSFVWIILSLWLVVVFPLSSQQDEIVVEVPNGATMEFVWIEPGTFTMGTTDAEKTHMDAFGRGAGPTSGIMRYQGEELPAHEVTISRGFHLGRFEVTKAQWEAAMGTTPWDRYARTGTNPRSPAVALAWLDIQQFMSRLNEAAADSIYRLPTEAEWEYACRAGTSTFWWFGNSVGLVDRYAVIDRPVQPVGSKPPNPWGLYDMHGNVQEFVLDTQREYSAAGQVDPIGRIPRESGDSAGLRGGSRSDPAREGEEKKWQGKCAFRSQLSAGRDHHWWIGFRVLRQANRTSESVLLYGEWA